MNPHLSIILPLYNETQRLPAGLESVRQYLNGRNEATEVILIDDGSTDQTKDLVERLIADDPRFTLIAYPINRGKGHAVKMGMLAATGAVRLFADIDMSVPIARADEFLDAIEAGHDIVIGTRKVSQSSVVVHQPRYREVLGEIFRKFAQRVFAPGISDFTCGFKAFRAQAAQAIFSKSQIPRWSFDAEILFLASQWGFRIHEIPVSWTNSPSTKVNLLVDVGRSLIELLQIRWNWFRERYQ